jgi:hypothetical protein
MQIKTVSEICAGDKIKFCRRWWEVKSVQTPARSRAYASKKIYPDELLLVLESPSGRICQIFNQATELVCQEFIAAQSSDEIDRQKATQWLTQFKEKADRWQCLHVAMNRKSKKKGGKS